MSKDKSTANEDTGFNIEINGKADGSVVIDFGDGYPILNLQRHEALYLGRKVHAEALRSLMEAHFASIAGSEED